MRLRFAWWSGKSQIRVTVEVEAPTEPAGLDMASMAVVDLARALRPSLGWKPDVTGVQGPPS